MANTNPSPENRFDGSVAGPGRPPGSLSLKGTAKRLAQAGDRDRLEAIVNNLFRIAENEDNLPAAVSAAKELKEWFDGKETVKTEVQFKDGELVVKAGELAEEMFGADKATEFMSALRERME